MGLCHTMLPRGRVSGLLQRSQRDHRASVSVQRRHVRGVHVHDARVDGKRVKRGGEGLAVREKIGLWNRDEAGACHGIS